MSDLPIVSAGPVYMRIQAARLHGVSLDFVLNHTGLDEAVFHEPDGRLTIVEDNAVWRAIVDATGDEYIGLRLARHFKMSAFGIVGYVVMNARTLGDALQKFNTYERLVIRTYHHYVERDSKQLIYGMRMVGQWYPERRHTMDLVMAGVKKVCEELTGHDLKPTSIGFQFEQPDDLTHYQDVFGDAPLSFATDHTHIVFDSGAADLPIIGAIPEMYERFEKQAQTLLNQYKSGPTYSYKVKRHLVEQLGGDAPTLQSTADHLAISIRSLQNKLKDEGASFQALLNTVRCDIATGYLAQPEHTKTEIAYLLGFSEVSVFSRLFKQWTGQTPSAYQRGL